MPRRDPEGRHKGGLVRMGIRGIAGGVGLVSESIKARKETKAAEKEAKERGTVPQPNSEGDSSFGPGGDEPPPSYSAQASSRAADDQYPDEKLVGKVNSNKPSYNESPKQATELQVEIEQAELEDEWNLDDAQDDIIDRSPERLAVYDMNELEDNFLRNNPFPQAINQKPVARLAHPVILPQRRPKDRSRGFIRAYAPLLQDCGIDQATWLSFLDNFQKSSAANPWLNAINLAAIATNFIPSHPIAFAAGYAINKAVGIAIELQSRERTAAFLQKINQEFFRPRGLYCLVMTWNPESTRGIEHVDLNATIASRSEGSFGSQYRTSDGNTYGEFSFPQVAPLVFPALDELAAQTSADSVKKKGKMAGQMKFVGEYWDKRAAAEFAMKNPGSVLAQVPQGEFSSRYADPKNHAASGSLIAFVSGGKLIPGPNSRGLVGGLVSVVGQAVRGEKQGSEWESYTPYAVQRKGTPYNNQVKIGLVATPVSVYKKLVKKNVLYLMVVNMPSEEEMATANKAFRM